MTTSHITPSRLFVPEPELISDGSSPEPALSRESPVVDFRVGREDSERLSWLASAGWADAEQLSLRFGGSPEWLRQRLRQLQTAGYLEQVALTAIRRNGVGYALSDQGRRRIDAPDRETRTPDGGTSEIVHWSLTTIRAVAERADHLVTDGAESGAADLDLVATNAAGVTTGVLITSGRLRESRLQTRLEQIEDTPGIDRVLWFVPSAAQAGQIQLAMGELDGMPDIEAAVLPEPRVEDWRTLAPFGLRPEEESSPAEVSLPTQ